MTPEELREIRKMTGLSQSKFARLLGYKRHFTISEFENGRKSPPEQTLILYRLVKEGKLKP